MDDKRTALAMFACIMFIMVYSELFLAPVTRPAPVAPAATEQQTAQQVAASTAQANASAPTGSFQQQPASVPATSVAAAQVNRHPNPAELDAAGYLEVESALISARISKLGGRLSQLRLKAYKLHLSGDELVDLVSRSDGAPLPLAVHAGGLNDDFVSYGIASGNAQQTSFVVPETNELKIRLTGSIAQGVSIEKTFTFKPGSYLFDVEVRLSSPTSDGSKVSLDWSHFVSDIALADRLDPFKFSLLSEAGKLTHVMAQESHKTAIDTGRKLSEVGLNHWVAFGGKYFMAALIPSQDTSNFATGIDEQTFFQRTYGTAQDGSFTLYVGPKDYRILKGLGWELQRSIDLGWFSFLAFPLISIIRFFQHLLGNYGLAIVLLTLVIKALFLPLTKASFNSMRAMQEIQPEVKALRERIKDATQLNQEMMALYKRKGVNPMGGCLPILIQLPVFLGLYNALLNSIELRHAPFALWITDLSAPEALHVFGIGVPVMVLLMGASMFFQQLTTPSTGDEAQRKAMMMMPIVFTIMFVIFPFPAGLVLYWLVNNAISIVQQMFLRADRRANPLQATLIASVGIFCLSWALTLIH
ncbi:MAG: membrane protein insertase YidC [Oligoflexia bacterium]|nr:membrane protein insertase YidC [Oligoflexia bacterium]